MHVHLLSHNREPLPRVTEPTEGRGDSRVRTDHNAVSQYDSPWFPPIPVGVLVGIIPYADWSSISYAFAGLAVTVVLLTAPMPMPNLDKMIAAIKRGHQV